MQYILGTSKANAPFTVEIWLKTGFTQVGTPTWEVLMPAKHMIFGGGGLSGSGVSNIANSITLVPYTAPEIVEG